MMMMISFIVVVVVVMADITNNFFLCHVKNRLDLKLMWSLNNGLFICLFFSVWFNFAFGQKKTWSKQKYFRDLKSLMFCGLLLLLLLGHDLLIFFLYSGQTSHYLCRFFLSFPWWFGFTLNGSFILFTWWLLVICGF